MNAHELVAVSNGDLEVTVVPRLGARLHSLTFRGQDVMRTPPDIEDHARKPFYWGGYIMAPWCNRIVPGPVEIGGRTIDLPSNFSDGTAIHGQVYVVPWQQTGEGDFSIEGEGNGWPWRYRVELGVRVDGYDVVVAQTLHNLDEVAMPGGIGIHPWFAGRIDLMINSDKVFASNDDSSPQPEQVSGNLDLRQPRALEMGVDAAWPDVAAPQVVMTWPEARVRVDMNVDAPEIHIVAAHVKDVPDAIAVEPETHAPQGLRRLVKGEPGGLAMIAPGDALRLITRYSFSTID